MRGKYCLITAYITRLLARRVNIVKITVAQEEKGKGLKSSEEVVDTESTMSIGMIPDQSREGLGHPLKVTITLGSWKTSRDR